MHVRVLAGTVSPSGPHVCRAVALPGLVGPRLGGGAVGGVSAPRADADFAGKEHGGGVAGDGGFGVSWLFFEGGWWLVASVLSFSALFHVFICSAG